MTINSYQIACYLYLFSYVDLYGASLINLLK